MDYGSARILHHRLCYRLHLVENLFFDNRKEADYLLSEIGQQRIAQCIVDSIKAVEALKPI